MIPPYEIDRQNKKLWRRRILGRRGPGAIRARQGIAALALEDLSRSTLQYAELHRVRVSVLYEEVVKPNDALGATRVALRYCGYGARQIAHGVQWGGVENSLFFKDLTLAPNYRALGQRLDLVRELEIERALHLDQCLADAAAMPCYELPELTLPSLWVGFKRSVAIDIEGDGPELEAICRQRGLPKADVLRTGRRDFESLVLLPLEWVSMELSKATTVFADLREFSKPRAFRIARFPNSLAGFRDAASYDFYQNAFRRCGPVVNADRVLECGSECAVNLWQ